ncbi:hypothetical protein [Paenibacillus alkalitolerans]|uniref:hypothetical protein n=1 Tax=Paenibacillus alkalitolerans TaxID=2799335 RepID=UPI0018F3ACF9|nr:hypothetical protein [Paenibacillus alkalitolerans]
MKRKLNSDFKLIPEGEQVVRIAKIDESDYAKFQKIVVHVEDANGGKARENFNFVNNDETPNEVAEGIYARMCRAAMNDQTLDEVDTKELIGKFVTVEIVHTPSDKGGTFCNIKKWIGPGEPFTPKQSSGSSATAPAGEPKKKTAAEILEEMRAKKAAAGK